MLRMLILLVATLAAVVLAVPTPKQSRGLFDWSLSIGLGSASKHSFKSESHGHRGNRDPHTEISRVYNKFNWDTSNINWSVTIPLVGATLNWEFPSTSGESSQGYGSYGSSDDSPAGSSYGSPDGSSDGTSDSSSDPSSGDSSYGSSEGSSDGSSDSSPTNAPQPYVTADSPDSYATSTYAVVEPSGTAVDATMDVSISTFASMTTFATSTYEIVESSGNAADATEASTFATSTTAAAAPTDTTPTDDGSGEVTASPEENESEYLSPVTIGGQKFNLNFDTGSADLWVFSTSLSSDQLGDHSVFDPSKSSTWEEYSEGSWEILYGDGSGASGTVGFDTVDVGGATATKQAVELATVVSSAFVSDENNDGLLGLAFGSINTIQPTKQKSFFESIEDQLEEKLFTADLDVDASGTYEFGKLDTSKYQGELHTTPIDNSRGFWEFVSSTYSINDKEVQNYNASTAIADTGTSLMMVDDEVAEAFYAQIEGATLNSEAGGYVYPCDAQVPSFGVAIGTSGFIATINGSDVEYARVNRNTCFGGIQGNNGQGIQIYGAVLLKQYFAVFNFGDLTFGLAQKN